MLRRNKASGAACLLVAILWLLSASATLAQVEHGGPAIAPPASTATPAPVVTPTPDRLAAPPTVPSPNQADEGAQLYWLHCQPCHGDRGQGLTDEWRAQYPPEDSNCWESGCHGNRPYDQGFILPTAVPAVIGDTVLQKFQTMDEVYRYVSVAMPYFFPGDLTQAEYLAIVAHLARENGLWDGQTLTPDNLLDYPLPGGAVATAQPPPTTAAPAAPAARPTIDAGRIGLIALVALIAVGGIFLWRNRIR